jgi:DNA-binding response OmpR family regulator
MRPHILFVDDEKALGDMLSIYFRHRGVDVCLATNPAEATAAFTQNRFQAVVLDLNLAGEDGLEVLRHVKKESPLTPVIIFTGLDVDENLVKTYLADRAEGFIRKTAGLGTLFAEVDRLLKVSQ